MDSPHVPELGSVPMLDKRLSLHQAISNTTAMLRLAPVNVGKKNGMQSAPTACSNNISFAVVMFSFMADYTTDGSLSLLF